MRLSALLSALPPALALVETRGEANPVIGGLAYDSRRVVPGDLFVALRGAEADGHDYLADAVRLGASALLVEGWPEDRTAGQTVGIRVPDTRAALALLACAFYGDPGAELRMVGVTGTNGKTSTTYLIESILAAAGRSVGLIGTVEIRYGETRQRTLNTTPESLDLQRTLRAMRTAGIQDAVMEVSSHGVAMGRIDGCRFDVAAFTNLTQDHLDFHQTMDAYRDAKTAFFRHSLRPNAVAVVNEDDPAADAFRHAAEETGARVLGVARSAGGGAEVALAASELSLDATRARLHTPSGELEVELPLIGDFNLENLLVAVGTAVGLGIAPEAIREGVQRCPQVPGRVERVGAELPGAPVVLVDYAHTPDAVDKLLRTVRPLVSGRLVTVFGCGGDRDRGKRPLMAEAAGRSSHRVVATSDNPRTEDPLAILRDVEAGLTRLRRVEPHRFGRDGGTYTIVPDRREAIGLAVASAAPDDIVVIAGKGHEDYQILGRERLPFDDRAEARAALQRRAGA
jgi:UDP-N-acetylmuramoyl-L-alanyl-D-glutamate--2,6-diaminopimelate ligase